MARPPLVQVGNLGWDATVVVVAGQESAHAIVALAAAALLLLLQRDAGGQPPAAAADGCALTEFSDVETELGLIVAVGVCGKAFGWRLARRLAWLDHAVVSAHLHVIGALVVQRVAAGHAARRCPRCHNVPARRSPSAGKPRPARRFPYSTPRRRPTARSAPAAPALPGRTTRASAPTVVLVASPRLPGR